MELEEVIEAYFDCRHNKRNTMNALRFEIDYETECIRLWEEIEARRYEPNRSIAFVIEDPVKREIFAADFRDRVVHHIIARRIYPLLEKQFHPESYSTQKGKGTLYGIQHIEQHIRDCSEDYTRDCYIMKLDISGFFMSIEKQKLFDCVMRFVGRHFSGQEYDELEYLLEKTIFNRPELDCVFKVPRRKWKGLPANKSLLGTDGKSGLPIGNLTSQLLALLYLDELDHLVTGEWGVVHYGRYVDDMVLVHPSKQHLLEVRNKISDWLEAHGLRLHPKKMYLQHYKKGVKFIGGVIKPGRKYVTNRTTGRLFSKMSRFDHILGDARKVGKQVLKELLATMNSYLGMMCHYDAQRLFRRVLARLSARWYRFVYVSSRARRHKLVLRQAYA